MEGFIVGVPEVYPNVVFGLESAGRVSMRICVVFAPDLRLLLGFIYHS